MSQPDSPEAVEKLINMVRRADEICVSESMGEDLQPVVDALERVQKALAFPLRIVCVEKRKSSEDPPPWIGEIRPWFQLWLHPEGYADGVKIAVRVTRELYEATNVGDSFRPLPEKRP
jgi:hypothetical protein